MTGRIGAKFDVRRTIAYRTCSLVLLVTQPRATITAPISTPSPSASMKDPTGKVGNIGGCFTTQREDRMRIAPIDPPSPHQWIWV